MAEEEKNLNLSNSAAPRPLDTTNSDMTSLDQRLFMDVKGVLPVKRQEVLKWFGWGYKDSEFYVKDDVICFRGDRYPLDDCSLPYFTEWVKKKLGINLSDPLPTPSLPQTFPKPTDNSKFLEELKTANILYSQEGLDRLIRCHGQALHDIFYLRYNKFKRIPDIVTWPCNHDEVKKLVTLAHKHNVVVLPYGGGTSVSGSITCPQDEIRMICVLDTSQMNRMLWLSKENLTACFEAGIVGQDLEKVLNSEDLTLGHEPDSYEFSTLGGWVATRASGMKKNTYGNIEDLVVSVKLVAPSGVLERQCNAPRISCGPDFNHIVMGSEGTMGVVTEVVIKVRPLPPIKRYGSLLFPDFESGVKFMREVARRRCQPASVRLIDNEQFIMGQTLKPTKAWLGEFVDYCKKAYLTTVKGIDLTRLCAVTLLFEGEQKDVDRQEAVLLDIAKKFKGFSMGDKNGERGYILTFVIAYIRDLGLQYDVLAESFETSVPWDRCYTLCCNVKRRLETECQKRNINYFLASCRVTQTYDAGACVYFYFAFHCADCSNPVETYEIIEAIARNEILSLGGSISHHHGVGKIRSQWYGTTVTDTGIELYKATKHQLDPKNIFAAGNLLPEKLFNLMTARAKL